MTPKTRIRISPPVLSQPHTACLPAGHAQRWNSPYDGEKLQPTVSVFLTQPAYCRICVHAGSNLAKEVGGVLVGQWCADAENSRQFVVVEYVLPARFTRQGSVFLTFTQDSLVDLHTAIDKHFTGKNIVGWYHTHPRMGVFLSRYDTWLHSHFFPEAWQVALVLEPHSSSGGFFIRQMDGSLDPSRYFGFYELDGDFGRSMVTWSNLYQFNDKKGDISDE